MNRNTKKISLTILALIAVIALIIFAAQNLFSKDSKKTANQNPEQNKEQSKDEENKIIEGEAKNLLEVGDNDIVFGDKNAPITVIEYASLSCPHCATFYSDAYPKLKEEYIKTGKVKFIYRDFPLNQPALVAGMLALCQVKDKNVDAEKYYDFIKVLFKTQESWAFAEDFALKLETIAKLDGISSDRFKSCIKDSKLQDLILKGRMDAEKHLQIQSTPTFFVGNEMVNGYGGYGDIKSIIEKKLSNTTGNIPSNPTK
jgi:protein-disulfide isomerase